MCNSFYTIRLPSKKQINTLKAMLIWLPVYKCYYYLFYAFKLCLTRLILLFSLQAILPEDIPFSQLIQIQNMISK